jgi:hypothetical protein
MRGKPKPTSPERIARGRPAAIARALLGAASPALLKFGFKRHEVLTRWSQIVGAPLAAVTLPERIVPAQGGATLVVRVDGAAGLEIQHLAPQIMERVNGFLGGPVVARLKLVQGQIPRRQVRRAEPDRPLSAKDQGLIDDATKTVTDQALRDSLVALGRRILLRKGSSGERFD